MKKLWADRAWDDFFRISSWNALEVMAKIGMEATSGREMATAWFYKAELVRYYGNFLVFSVWKCYN